MKKQITLILIVIAIIAVFAVLDIVGEKMWEKASGEKWGEPYQKAQSLYTYLFFGFSYVTFLALAVGGYIYRKDFSEAAAVFVSGWILLSTGLEDLFFYLLKGLPLFSANLTWLGSNKLVTRLSDIMGFPNVTGISLIISIIIGLLLVIVINILLYNYRRKRQ